MRVREGVALPMVLWALALVSALAVGGSFVARRVLADERSLARSLVAEPEPERMVAAVLSAWDSTATSAQAIGTSVPVTTPPGSAWITRLGADSYWLVAEVDAPTVGSRRIGVLIRVSAGRPALVPDRPWAELP